MGFMDFLSGDGPMFTPGETPSPFQRVFNPSNNSTPFSAMTGTIGRALGVPTAAENAGALQSQALDAVSRTMTEQGLPPDKAILQFFQSPEGQKLIGSGTTDFNGLLDGFRKLVTPAPLQHFNTPAGTTTTMVDPATNKVTGSISQPTTETQNVTSMIRIGNLPPEKVKEIAELQAVPAGAVNDVVKSQQFDRLQAAGLVDPKMRLLLESGQIQIMPLKTATGDDTGNMVFYDKTQNPPVMKIVPIERPPSSNRPGQETGAPNGLPAGAIPTPGPGRGTGITGQPGAPAPAAGAQPRASLPADTMIPQQAVKPDGTVDWGKVDPKTSMFLAAGPSAALSNLASRAAEALDPRLPGQIGGPVAEGQVMQGRRNAMAQYESALANLSRLGQNGGLGIPKEIINKIKDMQEGAGLLTSPDAAIRDAISMRTALEQHSRDERYMVDNDHSTSKEVKQQALVRIDAYQRVLDQLPSVGDMKMLLADYRAGKTSNTGLMGLGKDTIVAAGGKVKETYNDVRGNGTPPAKGGQPQGQTNLPPVNVPQQQQASPADQKLLSAIPSMDEGTLIQTFQQAQQAKAGPAVMQALAARAQQIKNAKAATTTRPVVSPGAGTGVGGQ